MADSVYISKHLDENQLRFMKLLQAHEILYFDMHHIEQQLHQSFDNLHEILENLTHKELLYRIERGKYAIASYQNIHVLSTFIGSDSCVAYWSALHYHGLSPRFPNKEFVKTSHRKRPTTILGTPIQYISVKPTKLIGIQTEGYGDDLFPITNIEMTMVDCFDQPRYAGNLEDVIAAFAHASLSQDRLIEYTEACQNIAITKRLGYLAQMFHSEELQEFIDYARSQVNTRYTLMDAGGENKGDFIKEWKIRMNVSPEDLIKMAQQEY